MFKKILIILIFSLINNISFSQDGKEYLKNDTMYFTQENASKLKILLSALLSGIANGSINIQDVNGKDISEDFYELIDSSCESLFTCNYEEMGIFVTSIDYIKLGELEIVSDKRSIDELKNIMRNKITEGDYIMRKIPNISIIRRVNDMNDTFIITQNE